MPGRLAVRIAAIALALGLTGCATRAPAPAASAGQPPATQAQNDIILAILVKADGTVGDIRVEKSSGTPKLDRAAVDFYRHKAKYQPGTIDGKPVDGWKTIKVVWNFK